MTLGEERTGACGNVGGTFGLRKSGKEKKGHTERSGKLLPAACSKEAEQIDAEGTSGSTRLEKFHRGLQGTWGLDAYGGGIARLGPPIKGRRKKREKT